MKNNVKDIIYDVMFKHIKPEFDKIDKLKGYWAYGSNAGLCCWALSTSASGSGRSSGACLFKDEKCWKIYNGSENGSGFDKYYNIIVHFNDNDEITNVEWVDDSIFEVFDKEFMYSIYEDLKKYVGRNDDSNTHNDISEYINMRIDKIKDEIVYDLSKVFEKYDCDEIIDKITDDIYNFDEDTKKSGLAVSNMFLLGSLMSLLEIREELNGKSNSDFNDDIKEV